jgi:hypothetical protein
VGGVMFTVSLILKGKYVEEDKDVLTLEHVPFSELLIAVEKCLKNEKYDRGNSMIYVYEEE